MTECESMEREALLMLPHRLAKAVVKTAALHSGIVNEIRIRCSRPLSITTSGKNYQCGVVCTREEVALVVRNLCGNSLYSHSETIREGYICASNGIRAGICGRAVVESGRIMSVTEITSLCIRIPRRVRGAADEAYGLLAKKSFSSGMLVYSKPGVGKTTLLREMIAKLAGGESPMRVAVIDTRYELCAGLNEALMVDVLNGYPRGKGIEIAMRTLSPQYIVCDEIGSIDDVRAIAESASSGVKIIASIHADSYSSLKNSVFMQNLKDKNIFEIYFGLLSRDPHTNRYETEITYDSLPDGAFCYVN